MNKRQQHAEKVKQIREHAQSPFPNPESGSLSARTCCAPLIRLRFALVGRGGFSLVEGSTALLLGWFEEGLKSAPDPTIRRLEGGQDHSSVGSVLHRRSSGQVRDLSITDCVHAHQDVGTVKGLHHPYTV